MRKSFLLAFLLLFTTYLTQAQFTAGNLAVFRAEGNNPNTTVSIIEVDRATAGQTFPVTSYAIEGTTGPNALRVSGSAGTTG